MAYVAHFADGKVTLDREPFGKHDPVIVGDLLTLWCMPGQSHFHYLIDGNEGGFTPIGTFEREVAAATFANGTLLIATKEYAETHVNAEGDIELLPTLAFDRKSSMHP